MSQQQSTQFLQGISLREYTSGYLDAMFRLDEICFAEPFRVSRAAMRRFAEARKAHVLLALHKEELAAFSIVHVERTGRARIAYLLTLDVASEFRRHGLGRFVLGRAEATAAEAGCQAMLLHVFTGNDAAIALYEKLGYIRVGFEENFYRVGLHAWVYQKPLA